MTTILEPARAHRFRVLFREERATNALWTDDNKAMLMTQVIACEIDYTNRQIMVALREPVSGDFAALAIILAKQGFLTLGVETLSAGVEVKYGLVFHNLSPLEHRVVFDYNRSDTLNHSFRFGYGSVELTTPKERFIEAA